MAGSDGNAKGRSMTLHMVSSLDGFIAKKDNSVGWLESAGVGFALLVLLSAIFVVVVVGGVVAAYPP